MEEVGEPGPPSVALEKMLTFVCRGDIPILVCIEEAGRLVDCVTGMPCLKRVDVRELVEALRNDNPLCGCSDDILVTLESCELY